MRNHVRALYVSPNKPPDSTDGWPPSYIPARGGVRGVRVPEAPQMLCPRSRTFPKSNPALIQEMTHLTKGSALLNDTGGGLHKPQGIDVEV